MEPCYQAKGLGSCLWLAHVFLLGRRPRARVFAWLSLAGLKNLYSVLRMLQAWAKAEECKSSTAEASDVGTLEPQVESIRY